MNNAPGDIAISPINCSRKTSCRKRRWNLPSAPHKWVWVGIYTSTLGQAYVANDRYDEAFEEFKRSVNSMSQSYSRHTDSTRELWSRVAAAGKNAKDERSYVEMVDKLANATASNPTSKLHADITLAEFYRERDPEKAKAHLHKTGFIAENAWWIIGRFDNTGGIGYNSVYIPEDATQIDTDTEYNGIDSPVSWQKQTDDTVDGFVNFGSIFDKNTHWNTAYAWTTVDSPDDRKAELRFGSGTQAKTLGER